MQKISDIQVMPKLIQALTDEYADVRKEAAIGKFLIIKLLLTMSYHQSPFQHSEDQVKPDTNPHQQEVVQFLKQVIAISHRTLPASEVFVQIATALDATFTNCRQPE
ncbi:MAG: hypothetical protein V7K92_22840 [Nostoc sp.]